jgi:hypothetical protein
VGIDIGVLYKKLFLDDKCRLLPVIASCSKGQLGALNAEDMLKDATQLESLF